MRILNYSTSSRKKIAFFYVLFVLSLILFSIYVHFFRPNFDTQVMVFIRRDRGLIFSDWMAFISLWGLNTMMILPVFAASAVFFVLACRKEALWALSVFIADGVNIILKLLIHRSRPQAMDVYPKFQQASFPSGHVVHYTVFFGFILTVMLVSTRFPRTVRWLVGALCVFLIGGVSVARIYLGTHWPTDILAAYIIGFVMLAPVILMYLKRPDTGYAR